RCLERLTIVRTSDCLSLYDADPTHPDRHLADIGSSYHVSTLVAAVTTLACHLFQKVTRTGAKFILEAFRYFAHAHVWLASGTGNRFQSSAVEDIPHDVRSLINRFGLDVDPIVYAVCSSCSALHKPRAEGGRSTWPNLCTEPVFGSDKRCQEPLLQTTIDGTTYPIRTLVHLPFADWFGRFISLPGVEEHGDRFCEAVDAHSSAPSSKATPADGDLVHAFPSPRAQGGRDGLFIADRGVEGRWLFMLEVDFFNVEGNTAGGSSRSTGVGALVCLNLPLSIRNDDAYRYPAFILGGPKEPDSKQAHHQHSAKLLSHTAAFIASAWPASSVTPRQTSISAADWKDWLPADNTYLRTGAELWQAAADTKTRKLIEKFFGVRGSQLWRLPYWNVTQQLVVDPMHCIYLGDCKRHFSEGLGLYDPKPGVVRSRRSESLAIRNPFPRLPPLSRLTLELPSDPLDLRALDGLSGEKATLRKRIVQYLRTQETLEEDELRKAVRAVRKRLHSQKSLGDKTLSWPGLVYVCNDLGLLEEGTQKAVLNGDKQKAIKRKDLAALLADYIVRNLITSQSLPNTPNLSSTAGSAHRTAVQRSEMSHSTAYVVGNVRRLLLRPLEASSNADDGLADPSLGASELQSTEGEDSEHDDFSQVRGLPSVSRAKITPKSTATTEQSLREALKDAPEEALTVVCQDLNCYPGEDDKESLIEALMGWRTLQQRQGLEWAPICPHTVLERLHDCLQQLVKPGWLVRPPLDTGLPSAGKLKAAHWKRLYELFLPLTLLSLWQPGSPTAVEESGRMAGQLQTAMHLSCACLAMTADVSTDEQRERFATLYARHLEGLERDCPGISTPNHHISFHIRDFMSLLGPVRNWWCFPFERLLGRMQRMGINHKPGQYEKTLLTTYYERAFFRQALMRIDIPFIQDFRRTMDKILGFGDEDGDGHGSDEDDAEDGGQDGNTGDVAEVEIDDAGEIVRIDAPRSILSSSAQLRNVPLLPRRDGQNADSQEIPAAGARIRGRTYSAVREQNSYVGFTSHKSAEGTRWTAGKIVSIRRDDRKLKFRIRPFAPVEACKGNDPFSAYWSAGFEAQSVSALTNDEVEVSLARARVFHIAYWKLSSTWGVACSLEKVRPLSVLTSHFAEDMTQL
ncbi:hypothetical protein HDZ31DRAFT_47002, partial [Schizophyllum fasciatum]